GLRLFADLVLNPENPRDVPALALFRLPHHGGGIETPAGAPVGFDDRVESGERATRGPMRIVEEIGFLALGAERHQRRPQIDRLDAVTLELREQEIVFGCLALVLSPAR